MIGYRNGAWPYLMTADQLWQLKQRTAVTHDDRAQGWCKTPWLPIAAELVADILNKPVDEVRATFGDTVEYRRTLTTVELRPGPPSEAEIRARVSRILAGAGV